MDVPPGVISQPDTQVQNTSMGKNCSTAYLGVVSQIGTVSQADHRVAEAQTEAQMHTGRVRDRVRDMVRVRVRDRGTESWTETQSKRQTHRVRDVDRDTE